MAASLSDQPVYVLQLSWPVVGIKAAHRSEHRAIQYDIFILYSMNVQS